MFNKKVNVMKKIVFTLMTFFAMAIIAGGAFAQNETDVLPGGTYTYNLTGVYSANAATATVTYGGTGATVTQVGTTWAISAATTSTVSFTIKYGTQAVPATDGDITVVITDNTMGGCSNSIKLTIDVQPVPTYTLALTKEVSTFEECQERTGAGDNTPDALGNGSESNTFTFTVTPVVTGVTGNFDYSYTISLPTTSALTDFDIAGPTITAGKVTHTGATIATIAPDVFTVTFKTTTGVSAESILAQLTIGAASTMIPEDGDGTYEAASGGDLSQTVTVKAVPTIGSFN